MKKNLILASFSLVAFVGMALPAVAETICPSGMNGNECTRYLQKNQAAYNANSSRTYSNSDDRDSYYYDNDRILETFRHGDCKYTVRRVNGDERITRSCN